MRIHQLSSDELMKQIKFLANIYQWVQMDIKQVIIEEVLQLNDLFLQY